MKINIKRENESISIPKFQTSGASGFDLEASEEKMIHPGQTVIVKTGLSFEIPRGLELQVRPRSGVTVKTKLRVCLGTVDSDYRGEVGIIVDNIGNEIVVVKKGERLAQGVICSVFIADFEIKDELNQTDRGASGFGSTGVTSENQ
jgi:dUTP pyrophosphatase